jgi:polyhydroxyalkanoate synthesis regulator phasin
MKPTMKMLAGDLVAAFKEHVAERLTPISSKLDAAHTVLNGTREEVADLHERIDALEAQVRSLESRLQVRRVA